MDSGIEKTLLSFDSKMYSITYWFVSKDGETLWKLIYFPSHVFWQWICSNLLQGYQSNSFQYRIIGGFAPKYFWGLLLLTWWFVSYVMVQVVSQNIEQLMANKIQTLIQIHLAFHKISNHFWLLYILRIVFHVWSSR